MGTLTIRQLAAGRRSVTLTGTAGPLVGAEWSTDHPGDAVWDPGAREGAALLPGGHPLPTTFSFRWRTIELLAGRAGARVVGGAEEGEIKEADRLVDLFLGPMLTERAAVHVRWKQRDRIAKLRRFTAPEGRRGEWLGCQLEVEWLTAEDTRQGIRSPTRPASFDPLSAVGKVASAWREALAPVVAPATMGPEVLASLGDAFGAVNAELRDAAALAAQPRRSPADNVARARETARALLGVEGAARSLSALVGVPEGVLAQSDDPKALAHAAHLRATTQRAATRAIIAALLGRLEAEDAEFGRAVDAYQAVDGEDLVWIALYALGDADRWREIATLNGLSSSVLSQGRRLQLPPRASR